MPPVAVILMIFFIPMVVIVVPTAAATLAISLPGLPVRGGIRDVDHDHGQPRLVSSRCHVESEYQSEILNQTGARYSRLYRNFSSGFRG